MARLIPYSDIVTAAAETAERILGAGWSVRTTMRGGTTAHVHWVGKSAEIALPTLPPTALMTRAESDAILGYLLHELTHCRRTELPLMTEAMRGGGFRLANLLNAIEDVRMERDEVASGLVPNARELFGITSETVTAKVTSQSPDGTVWTGNLRGDLLNAIVCLGRHHIGQDVPSATKSLATLADEPMRAALFDDFLRELPRVKDTRGALDLARQLHNAIAAQEEKEEDQRDTRDDETGETGETGGGETGGGETGEGETGEGETGEGEATGEAEAGEGEGEATGEGEAGEGETTGGGSKADAPDGDRTGGSKAGRGAPLAQDVQGIADIAARALKAAQKDGTASSRTATLAAFRKCAPKVTSNTNPRAAKRALDAIPTPARLRNQIARLLKAPELATRSRGETSGRLDRRALLRAADGARAIYTKRAVTDGVATGVVILLDGSGSMDPGKLASAHTLALHIGEAVEKAGGELLVASFTDDWSTSNDTIGQLNVAKDWNHRIAARRDHIGGLYGSGGTVLTPAIMDATNRLCARRHLTRRIVLALTDGECDYGAPGVRMACQYAERRAVDVIGIGCQHDVAPSFPRHVNVWDLATIATAGLAELVRLFDRRPRA